MKLSRKTGLTVASFLALCASGFAQHSVSLSWIASTTPDVTYNVYRSTVKGGPYAKISSVAGTSYIDQPVPGATTFYYVVTAVDTSGHESAYSAEVAAIVPPTSTTTPNAPSPAGILMSLM